ncbi:MAG TPA: Nramp family divalent metal transporter [Balneolaceae bacterium]|nr:Nramp family divalent metal transporter [Balneolaceae bacterium]
MDLKNNIVEAHRSLEDVHASVDTINNKGKWKKLLAFLGPAYLISVGYMDPGNWATDIAAGSQFQYALIWVLLLSNMMALLLQFLSAKLGLVRGRDLAQASRETYPTFINLVLYGLAEIAIAATDLAEVLGMAIGLKLLFGLPILIGVSVTILDTFLLLVFQKYGMRKMEAFIISLIGIIGISFLINLFIAHPDISNLATGFLPTLPNSYALYIAIGIIGATVMPHNLYLHSALVQTRKIDRSESGLLKAIKYNLIDSTIALNLAFFVNGAILVLSAAAFYTHGYFQVEGIEKAYQLLEPLLGTRLAPILFAVALIAAGQSSTITSTLAGQVVMEGYLHLRIQPWIRRLITRLLAIIPAFLTVYFLGSDSTTDLLILSQVILSIQLGFATIPLIHFVSDKKKMGEQAIGSWIKIASWATASIIVVLNIKLVWDEITGWMQSSSMLWIQIPVAMIAIAAVVLLIYITFRPWIKSSLVEEKILGTPHGEYPGALEKLPEIEAYKKIAITVDFSDKDTAAIQNAISQGGRQANYQLIHVVESAGAHIFGREISDYESSRDKEKLEEYVKYLEDDGYKTDSFIGFGSPKKVITKIVNENQPDILIMGAHGHKTFKDIIFGQTVDYVRHHVKTPVLIV